MAHLTAAAVWLTVLLQVGVMLMVSRARTRHGIKAPATTGHVDFERVYRVQVNTVESTLMFLPALWLAAQYWRADYAGILGLAWVASRAWYAWAYARDGGRRGPPYIISIVVVAALLLASGWGLLKSMLA